MQINKHNLYKLVKDLFPLHRSLVTDENEKTLDYISKKLKFKFNKIKFKCVSKFYDWTIPKKWILKDAYIKNIHGKKIIDVKKK